MSGTIRLLAFAALTGALGTLYFNRRAAKRPNVDKAAADSPGRTPEPGVADHVVPTERYQTTKGFQAR